MPTGNPCAGQAASGRATAGAYLAFPQQAIHSTATGVQIFLTHVSDFNTDGIYQAVLSVADSSGLFLPLLTAPALAAGVGRQSGFAQLPAGTTQFEVNAVWTDTSGGLTPNSLDVSISWFCGGDTPAFVESACDAISTVVYQNIGGSLVAGATGYGTTVTVDTQIWGQRPPATAFFFFQPFEFMWLETATHDPTTLHDGLEIQYQTSLTGGWLNWQTLRFYDGSEGHGYLLGASQGGGVPDLLTQTIDFRVHNYGSIDADFSNLTLYFLCHGAWVATGSGVIVSGIGLGLGSKPAASAGVIRSGVGLALGKPLVLSRGRLAQIIG